MIGDRAYGRDAGQVAVLGRAAAEGLLAGGVLPVVKHMPGHGRAGADSHLALPGGRGPREELERHDFAPFRMLADMPLAMTAHVVYTALDPERPATTSRIVMEEVIRGHIGYDGLVMTDDLSMQALSGSFRERDGGRLRGRLRHRPPLQRQHGGDERGGRGGARPRGRGPAPGEAALPASATSRSRSILWMPAPGSMPRLRWSPKA